MHIQLLWKEGMDRIVRILWSQPLWCIQKHVHFQFRQGAPLYTMRVDTPKANWRTGRTLDRKRSRDTEDDLAMIICKLGVIKSNCCEVGLGCIDASIVLILHCSERTWLCESSCPAVHNLSDCQFSERSTGRPSRNAFSKSHRRTPTINSGWIDNDGMRMPY